MELQEVVQSTIKATSEATAEALIKALKRKGLLKTFEKTAIDMTKDDIEQFNEVVELINQGKLPGEKKQDAAFIVRSIKKALNFTSDRMTDREMALFYSSHFQKQTIRSIAFQFDVDIRTVYRATKKALTLMAIYIHPDVFLDEIMN